MNRQLTRSTKKKQLVIGALFLGLIASIVLSLRVGVVTISFSELFRILGAPFFAGEASDTVEAVVVATIRLPRIVLALWVGMALAVSGCAMQGVFRNPMASPFVTGIASAGAFGAALTMVLGIGAFWTGPAAFCMAMLTSCFVYYLAKTEHNLPVETVLLAGISLSILFSALVSFVQYSADERELRQIVLWLMGHLWAADWDTVFWCAPFILAGTVCLLLLHKELNLLILGDRTALNSGVDVGRMRVIILILASLITSSAVAVSGVIGFVGLIVPHVMRMIVGPDHKYLLPSSVLAGGIFLIWTDTIGRTIMAPIELPPGIITAMIGVPLFLVILKQRKKLLGFSYGTHT